MLSLLTSLLFLIPSHASATQTPLSPHAGNPIFPGWYADPEARIFNSTYWIYPTTSTAYDLQTTFDAFSSPDLLTWTKHPSILTLDTIPWSTDRAAWAPSVIAKDGRWFMYFSADDGAGIGVAGADAPDGPFVDLLGKPLVPRTVFGAEAIDAQVFFDDGDGDGESGRYFLYWGGWGHAVVAELGGDMKSFVSEMMEITPDEDFVEGTWMMMRNGVYYFMYSVGGYVPGCLLYSARPSKTDEHRWGDNSYGVSYVTGSSPTGPFSSSPTRILTGDYDVGTSTGHNSVFTPDGKDYYIVYHRRYPNDTTLNHRVVCIDRMEFDTDGNILPVNITTEGILGRPLP